MLKMLYENPFENQKYQLQRIYEQQYVVERGIQINSLNKTQYLFQTYSLSSIQQRIGKRIINQIQLYATIKQELQLQCLYIYKFANHINYTLQYRYLSQTTTLAQFINNTKHNLPFQELIQIMKNIFIYIQATHQKKLCHHNLHLSNIFIQKNNRIILGPPNYKQICKYINRNHYGQIINRESDVKQLAAIFIQMITKIQSQITLQILEKIDNKQLRLLCSNMLQKNSKKRLNINEILQALNCIDKDQYFNFEEQKEQYFEVIKLPFLYGQKQQKCSLTKYSAQEVVSIKQRPFYSQINKTLIFIHSNHQFHFTINTKSLNKSTEERLKDINKSVTAKFTISTSGFLSIWQKKSMIINNQFGVNHLGTVQCKKGLSRGIFIWTNLLMCSMVGIYDEIQGKQMKYIQVTTQFNNKCKKTVLSFLPQYKNDSKNIHSTYAIMEINAIIYQKARNYITFIMDFDQHIINDLILNQNEDIYYNYQLGQYGLEIKDLSFHIQHKFFLINNNEISVLPGQPLRINFSNGNDAVIGIYVEGGKGILLDDRFYWGVYNLIAGLYEKISYVRLELSLLIVKCKQFLFEKQPIVNINTQHNHNYCQINQINDKSSMQQQIQRLVEQNKKQNIPYIGMLTFQLRKYCIEQKDYKNALRLCQQSINLFDSVYKMPICSTVICYNITYQINRSLTNKQKIDEQYREQLFIIMMRCIETLQRYNWNPIFLATSYYMAALCLSDYPQSIVFHRKSIDLCNLVNAIALLRRNYMAIVRDYQLTQQQMHQYYQTYQHHKYKSNIDSSHHGQFQRYIHKLQLFRQAKKYGMVNKILLLLFKMENLHFRQDQQKIKRLRQVWKSTLVEIMEFVNDMDELSEFEKITQTHYEQGYVHVRDCFRKKEQAIRQNPLTQLLSLLNPRQ